MAYSWVVTMVYSWVVRLGDLMADLMADYLAFLKVLQWVKLSGS